MKTLFPALIAGCLLFGGQALFAQDGGITVENVSPTQPKNWQFSAALDTYGLFNAHSSSSGVNALRNFDLYSNTVRLNAAAVGLEYKTEHFGAHVDAGYGDLFSTIAATDSWKGVNQYVTQAYVSYRPFAHNAWQLDFGKFYTSVGAEVPDTLSNFNYSRSLAFTLGAPYYHFGLRTSVPVTSTFTAGLQLIDGMNDVTSRNHGRMLALTSNLTKHKWGWNQVWITGGERLNGEKSKRNLVDEVVTFSPSGSLQGYFEFVYGHESRPQSGPAQWYGTAGAVKWSVNKKLSFSPRVEYFSDSAGFNSGTPQHLREVTLTADYKLHRFATLRFECRRDDSDQAVFDEGKSKLSKNQETLLVGFLMAWKKE